MSFMEQLNLAGGRHLPLIYQAEAAECALACLAMVASYHGQVTDLPTLRSQFPVSLKGLHLGQLIDIARRMEMTCRPIRIEMDDLAQVATPAILHWNMNHFVVLKKVTRKGVVIHDPARGSYTLALEEAAKLFTGVALELEPALQFKRKVALQPISLQGVLGKVKGLKQSLGQIIALALCMEAFLLLGPLLNQWIIDDALVSYDRDLLTLIVAGMCALGLMHAVVNFFRARTLLYVGISLNVQWVANVVSHLLKLPVSYFEKRNIGDIQTRFGAIAAIQHTLTSSFAAAILDGVMSVTTLIMLLVYSPTLAAIPLVAVLVYALLRELRLGSLRMASLGQLVRMGSHQSQFLETLRGIQAIKLFNRQSARLMSYMKLTVESANCDVEVQKVGHHFELVNACLIALESALILWLGGRMVLGGEFTIGMLMAFIAYKSQFTSRVIGLIDKSVELRMLGMHGERLADIVLAEPEPELALPYLGAAEVAPSLELRNISFHYEGEAWLIQNFNMQVAAGESVVLVGPSGAGKTTLLKILLGQLVPQYGNVLVGGVKLEQLGLSCYRDMIGVVMQSDQLLAGTLAQNIAFFADSIDMAWVEQCAQLAQVHADIARMPMGYNSLVGDMGSSLSGGQKQRIMLARALYKRPRILFLDEATSHLDAALETAIGVALGALAMTRVVIAHRQETIRSSGRVILIGAPSAHAVAAPAPEAADEATPETAGDGAPSAPSGM